MKMKRSFLSGVLALALLLTLTPGAAAAGRSPLPDETEAAQVLAALDIMVGYENGDLHLEDTVTRAEFVKMAVAATPAGAGVGAASTAPYPDVPKKHWAAGYIQASVRAGLVTGYLDGTFRPEHSITLAEGVTVVLRLLGYQNSDFSGAYPSGQMAKYRDLELDVGVTAQQNDPLTRRDCLYLYYNLLTTVSQITGKPYLYTLGHSLTAAGEIDMVSLINSAMEGPLVAQSGWREKLTFDPATARTVYRGGKPAQLSEIRTHDVVYWSRSMRALWAYTNKVSGTVNAVSPSAAAPTAVTVAGRTYTLETSSAAYALSDLGEYEVGDTVTLLLGRTGGVAAVRSGIAAATALLGIVEAVTPGSYTNASGDPYTANTLSIRATDGELHAHRCDDQTIKAGTLVEVFPAGNDVTVRRLSAASLTGSFSSDGTTFAGLALAGNAEILDTHGNSGLRVYPGRLAGVTLSETSDVRYYRLNAAGQLTHLVLNDATGDLHQYGVITQVNEVDAPGLTASQYVYDLGGQTLATKQLSKVYHLSTGPARLKWKDNDIDSITSLTSLSLSGLSGSAALSGNDTFPLWDHVVFYEKREQDYYLSSRSLVESGNFRLTGYYDKAPSEGGVIRIVVAHAVS